MDEAALEQLTEGKKIESIHYVRHLLDIAIDTHIEIAAMCNRTAKYPFALERNVFSFVFLAGATYNNLWNIVQKVNSETEQHQNAWRKQFIVHRAIKALVDRRDAVSHGRLDRWVLDVDGGSKKTKIEDDKYPHLPTVTFRESCTPIYVQWNDKHRGEFVDCLAWQEEVLQELYHQVYNFEKILQKIRSDNDPAEIVRRRFLLPPWNIQQKPEAESEP